MVLETKIVLYFPYIGPYKHDTCADPGIFARGGGVQVSLTKKALTTFFFFFFFFLVLSLVCRSQMVIFIEIYHFSRFQRGPTFSRGSNFFQGGVHLLIPYRNPYNLWFSRGGVRTPCPPSGSALVIIQERKHFSPSCSW